MDSNTNYADTDYDVLIVGAGMVGLSLAAALKGSSLRVGLVEAQTPEEKATHDDGRASAIALGSVQILDHIGAWKPMQQLGVSPIHQIRISDEGFTSVATLRREDIQVEALGYVVENWVTMAGLRQAIAGQSGIAWICPAKVVATTPQPHQMQVTVKQNDESRLITTQLLIGADGRQSSLRTWNEIPVTGWAYDQVLIVCTITTEHSHQQTGYERFHGSGPFAILPMVPPVDAPDSHRACVVWTAEAKDAKSLMQMDDASFIARMTPRISPELGQVLSVSPRAIYSPRRQNADRYYGDRLVLVGDAAHATHPVGGQGLNMGLRDVATLAGLLIQTHIQGRDLGDPSLLRHYQQQRRSDNETVLFGTDLANRLFSNTWLPLQMVRRLALVGVDQISPLKQLLLQYAMGLAAHHPTLVGNGATRCR